jgi:hypothetical protein
MAAVKIATIGIFAAGIARVLSATLVAAPFSG